MIETVRKHATFLALASVTWFGWSELDGDGATKQVAKAKRPGLADEVLEMRGPDEWITIGRDPTSAEPTPPAALDRGPESEAAAPVAAAPDGRAGWGFSPYYQAATEASVVSATWVGGVVQATDHVFDRLTGWIGDVVDPEPAPGSGAPRTPGAGADAPDDASRPPRPFTLALESTLLLPGAEQARISGQSVLQGQPIPGLDDESPPVLTEVTGVSVTVTHRGEVYELDLDGRRVVHVGGPAQVAPDPFGSFSSLLGLPSAPPKPAPVGSGAKRGKIGGKTRGKIGAKH